MIVISIIGGTGKMGRMFASNFRSKGHKVILSGRKTRITHEEAARKGDIVIVSVPINVTESVIKKISPFVRKNALLTDFTSVKVVPCNAMKRFCRANIVGGHPVFGPNVALKGQNFVLCPLRGKWQFYKRLLASLGLKISVLAPETHDKSMAVIQCLTHQSTLSYAFSLMKMNSDISILDKLASPQFRLKISLVRRMLDQDASLYSDIQRYNPFSNDVARIHALALKKCSSEFKTAFSQCQNYFGRMSFKTRSFINKLLSVHQ
ncbi:prephenate dehydrogenase/arogenate dehydrogenase family protein [Candidatus Woesearchaeota archaeon]|nr:prephenate dehydrogenase/arogenate dehydrogenase family protein [Candidatus Woesearchaeota archaeon]